MPSIRRAYLAALAGCAALAVGAPIASASPVPTGFGGGVGGPLNLGPIGNNPAVAWGPCGTPTGAEGQGGTGGTAQQSCVGAGLSYVGPAIGQIATVIGPTIISPGFVGTVIVSAGNAAAGGP
jgi:hypothetical protein